MDMPKDRKYLVSHEWHLISGDTATIGITQIAADELTDVTYVSLPKVGDSITAGSRFGEIESVKATSDMYTGLSGSVTEVNEILAGDPGLVNRDPYTAGWMIKIKLKNAAEADKLLAVDEYLKQTGH
jgi:glycine cleavage system H protein